MDKNNFQWPPLESDPEIFNRYFQKIGLNKSLEFTELWTLDYQGVQFFEGQIIGVIAAIERKDKKYCEEENIIDYKGVPFYMKQEGQLDNACGLIAALHCLGNAKTDVSIESNSILDNFFKSAESQTPEERCQNLQDDTKFKEAHQSSASEGQSDIPSEQNQVRHHFIAFSNVNNSVVDLDGTLKGPVVVSKDSEKTNLLDESVKELKKRLEKGVITENLSVIVLLKN